MDVLLLIQLKIKNKCMSYDINNNDDDNMVVKRQK